MDLGSQHIAVITDRIVARHGGKVDAVIPILQDIQEEFNFLPEPAMKRVCETTDITPARISGISTFYTQFRHQPAGKHRIRVCTGTACHVKGAQFVYEAVLIDAVLAFDAAFGLWTVGRNEYDTQFFAGKAE